MENNIYKLEHSGFWLGGVIIVLAENLEKAKEIISETLIENGVGESQFNINDVARVEQIMPNVIYLSTGDY
jgi:hypothetical protein